jgi:hypothetical protein
MIMLGGLALGLSYAYYATKAPPTPGRRLQRPGSPILTYLL